MLVKHALLLFGHLPDAAFRHFALIASFRHMLLVAFRLSVSNFLCLLALLLRVESFQFSQFYVSHQIFRHFLLFKELFPRYSRFYDAPGLSVVLARLSTHTVLLPHL